MVTMMHADWEGLDELARGSIEQYLIDEVLCNVMEDTSKQIHEKLEEMFTAKSLSNKAVILLTSLSSSYKHFYTTFMFGKGT
ncbi:unnamed protein product [Prunus armeniaca]